jgi:arginyl-tRNA synthetase
MLERIRLAIEEALQSLDVSLENVQVSFSTDAGHGDYATNVAFAAAKKLGVSPLDAAERISQELRTKNQELFSKVEVAKPGFINMTIKSEIYLAELARVTSGENTVLVSKYSQKKVMIEFTDPNPFKEFHIGHLYSNIVGESIARLLEAAGAEVRRVNYQGDVGLHVAKALWGLQSKLQAENVELKTLEERPLQEKAKFLGEAYAIGARAYEEDEEAKQEIITINKKVYDKDPEIIELYQKGREWSLAYFETIYQRLGTKFVHYYFESKAGPVGLEVIREYLSKGVFIESEGAVIFPGEQYGLHNRVFINSLGLPTYEAKELGLAPTKYQDYPYDLSIIVTANEIDAYFKVLLKALSLINPDLAAKTVHLSHGVVRLPEGKMSSRTGNVVTGEWLLDEAHRKAFEKMQESGVGKDLAKEEQEEVAEIVGVGAVKYALLRGSIGKDTTFNFDESVSFDGNAGPYLQYTFVRTQSVLRKANRGTNYEVGGMSYEVAPEERDLLRYIAQYIDVVGDAAEHFSPSTVATYLFELAQLFNLFYQKYSILTAESEEASAFRLALTKGVGETLKSGLNLLGISTPERM